MNVTFKSSCLLDSGLPKLEFAKLKFNMKERMYISVNPYKKR